MSVHFGRLANRPFTTHSGHLRNVRYEIDTRESGPLVTTKLSRGQAAERVDRRLERPAMCHFSPLNACSMKLFCVKC
jgi:hypothetical protein